MSRNQKIISKVEKAWLTPAAALEESFLSSGKGVGQLIITLVGVLT